METAAAARRVVMLTGGELRHDFVRMALAASPGIDVVRTYCEGLDRSLGTLIDADADGADIQREHVSRRERSEEDFFAAFCHYVPDETCPVALPKGAINDPAVQNDIIALEPDVVVAFGCSIVREPLLSAFSGRFLNAHLGLSPYYRGSGTNFWALVNGEPELVGVTFMHIDAGVDTGAVLHQRRATIHPGDDPHQIGNRLIRDMASDYAQVVRCFESLSPCRPTLPEGRQELVYRRADFTPEAVVRLYQRFEDGLIESYLSAREEREERALIVRADMSPEVAA